MTLIMIGFFSLFGLVIGSYLNVVIYRLPLKLSTAKGRSFCPQCHHTLQPLDLVPVFSWLFLGRQCRYCKEPISWRYPFIELLCCLGFGLCIAIFPMVDAIIYSFFLAILIVVAMIDLDTMEIPDRMSIFILLLGVILLFLHPQQIGSSLIGAFVISIPLWVLSKFNAMGGGDVKLMFASGFLLGWQNVLVAFMLSSFIGSVYAIYLIVVKKRDRSSAIPFGPFLAMGLALATLYGPSLIQWYLTFF